MTHDIRTFHFYKNKNSFSGNIESMRFLINPIENENGKVFQVTVWPGPFCIEKTADEKKIVAEYPFSEEGLEQVKTWLNKQHSDNIEEWNKY